MVSKNSRNVAAENRELKQKFEQQNKTIISTIYKAAHKLSLTETSNMYGVWKNYVAATNGQIVYGVKIDVKDAFGNINVDVLCEILEEQCEQNEIPSKIAKFIMNRIQHQFIAEGQNKKGLPTRVWKWKHGLLQGDRFSSALCELYMSYLDSLHLDKFHKPTNILHRTVDDYFFCSTNEEDVKEFINVMNSVHTLNIKKTESNLPNYGNNEIGYCGQIFNMNTKQVKSLYYFKKHSEIRHRFKFWNIRRPINNKSHPEKNIETFLWRPMTIAYNRYRFKNMELNTAFNSETRFMNNYFEAMIFLAFKFDASVMAVSTIIKDFSLVTIVVKKTAHKYSHMAIKRLKQNKGPYYTGLLTMQVFLKIGLQAFILVLKKRTLYQRQKIIEHLVKYTRRISINHNMKINFKRFKFLPKIFNNISISRRLTC